MTNLAQDLRALRVAAEQREWNILQDTLKQLLTAVEPLIGLSVAVNRAQDFLPVFESYYPEAGWVRQLLLQIVSYGVAPGELPMEALTQFPKPGCGNFIMAVFDIARAVQPKTSVFERYSYITNAVANTILADLQDTYYSQHLDQYDLLLDPDADPDSAAQVQYAFWLDGEVAARDTDTWLAVADEVETLLME